MAGEALGALGSQGCSPSPAPGGSGPHSSSSSSFYRSFSKAPPIAPQEEGCRATCLPGENPRPNPLVRPAFSPQIPRGFLHHEHPELASHSPAPPAWGSQPWGRPPGQPRSAPCGWSQRLLPVQRLEDTSWEELMRTPGLSSSENKEVEGRPCCSLCFVAKRGCGEGGARFFSPAPCVRTRGNTTRRKGSGWAVGKRPLYHDSGWVLQRASQGGRWCPRVQEAFA